MMVVVVVGDGEGDDGSSSREKIFLHGPFLQAARSVRYKIFCFP
jgi:hypothetical protein